MMVYLGLGSNLGERKENLLQAIQALSSRVGNISKCSSFYESEPWGFESRNSFLNAVVEVETSLSPEDLLKEIHRIEREMGKHLRTSRNEPYKDRPIDIDILLMEDRIYRSETLTIPHPFLHEREFVLKPLCEIAPEFIHPLLKSSIKELWERKGK